MLQAPAKHAGIAGRQEEARAKELGSGADQGPQWRVAFAHGVARKTEPGRVARETARVFHHGRPFPFDGLHEFDASVVAVDANTQRIALVDVVGRRPAHSVPRHVQRERWPLHGDERLANLEPQLCIQGQGARVIGGLDQSHPRTPALGNALQNCLHESASDHPVLGRGIDGDARNTGNGRALVEESAPDDAALELGDHAIVARVGQPPLGRCNSRLGRRKIRRELMPVGDRLERFVADGSAPLGVGGGTGA